jgi:hypothetical protein
MDKTEITLGAKGKEMVLISSNSKKNSQSFKRESGGRENISNIEYISALGQYLPNYIINKGKNILDY